jgi:exonuclease V gamma subunit
MCATKQFNKGETSCLICSDQTLIFLQIETQQAHRQLADYVRLFQQGLQLPLPIFPAASYAFAHSFCKKGDAEKATSAAHKVWQSNSWGGYSTGDVDDAYIQLALRNNLQDPLATDPFREHAQTLYELALSNGEFS